MNIDRYLHTTPLLDYQHPQITRLVTERGWQTLKPYDQIAAIYAFVQNEIVFGYNETDALPASRVLADGYGQCNTKTILLMALLRRVGLPCRFHAFLIDKHIQKGALTGLAYLLAPQEIIHSWVEVYYADRWINLEGFILDQPYLRGLQERFPDVEGVFCGYGVATQDFRDPPVVWRGTNTYIQKEGISHDYGVFDAPDVFYDQHGSNLHGVKQVIYSHVVRAQMNATIAAIRDDAPADEQEGSDVIAVRPRNQQAVDAVIEQPHKRMEQT